MFITEEEARRRLNDSRNMFSPNYINPKDRKRIEDRVDAERAAEDAAETTEVVEVPKDNEEPAPAQTMNISDIDKLLSGAVEPYKALKAKGNLRGEIDTQVAVGVVSSLLGKTTAGQLYDLDKSQAQAYAHGLSTPNDMKEMKDRVPERTRRLKSVKEQIAEKASARLTSALNSLTDEKIDGCSALKISAIAKDMAVVMDKVTKDNSKTEAIHFHVFRPEMKTVEQYTTVQVSAPLIINNDGGANR